MFIDSLFNRKALQEYILYAGQHPSGGLRDKPPKYIYPDLLLPMQTAHVANLTIAGTQTHTTHSTALRAFRRPSTTSSHPPHGEKRFLTRGCPHRVWRLSTLSSIFVTDVILLHVRPVRRSPQIAVRGCAVLARGRRHGEVGWWAG